MTGRRLVIEVRDRRRAFWWVARSGQNGQVLATSETYASRSNAVRAARAFIRLIDPAPIEFRTRPDTKELIR